jgi:hypothetical protein
MHMSCVYNASCFPYPDHHLWYIMHHSHTMNVKLIEFKVRKLVYFIKCKRSCTYLEKNLTCSLLLSQGLWCSKVIKGNGAPNCTIEIEGIWHGVSKGVVRQLQGAHLRVATPETVIRSFQG